MDRVSLLVAVTGLIFLLFYIIGRKIPRVRHGFVRMIWKVLDRLDDRWANKVPLPLGVKVESNIRYMNDYEEQVLDVYYPAQGEGTVPVVLYIHGGGFIAGDKRHTQQYAMTLAKAGYTVFNINYRLAPKFIYPTHIVDVIGAMNWIQQNAATYHGDHNKILIAGDSAGAYLAALTACIGTNSTLAKDLGFVIPFPPKKIKGVLLFSGLYDLETGFARNFASIKSDIEMFLGTTDIKSYHHMNQVSVCKNVTSSFPTTFISSGQGDGLYPETVELIKVLQEKGVCYQSFLVDKGQKYGFHNYQKQLQFPAAKECLVAVMEFMKTATK